MWPELFWIWVKCLIQSKNFPENRKLRNQRYSMVIIRELLDWPSMFKLLPWNHREITSLSGVLQGSILGRLFFFIYVNDLPDCLPEKSNNSENNLYADDTTIVVFLEKDSITKLTENLECIQKLLNCNRISLNMEKTVFIEFGNINRKQEASLSIALQSRILTTLNNWGKN